MNANLNDLRAILDLEPIEQNLFRGTSPKTKWQRVFGGQVIAQALGASCRTVEGRLPHSLHCYFLLLGDSRIPILYQVERLRDGRSYATRRVTAIQHGQPILSMMVSFHNDEESIFHHQVEMPVVPPPDKSPPDPFSDPQALAEMPESVRHFYELTRPVELRPIAVSPDDKHYRSNTWIRAADPLPDDPVFHLCGLAYFSDFTLLDTSMNRYGRRLGNKDMAAASLDHAMWFHRPFRADEWLLHSQDSPSAQGGRALTRGQIFKPDGTLVASVAQEGSIRLRRSSSTWGT